MSKLKGANQITSNQIKSNQIKFFRAQNHSQCVSGCFRVCTDEDHLGHKGLKKNVRLYYGSLSINTHFYINNLDLTNAVVRIWTQSHVGRVLLDEIDRISWQQLLQVFGAVRPSPLELESQKQKEKERILLKQSHFRVRRSSCVLKALLCAQSTPPPCDLL